MTYTISIDVAGPIRLYDAFHAALLEDTGGNVDGLLTHIAWPTPDGCRIIEVWTSKELCDRAAREILARVWSTLVAAGKAPPDPMPEELHELDTRGLIIPSAGVAV